MGRLLLFCMLVAGPDNWWAHYGDPTLDTLVQTALSRNLEIRIAEQRIEQARALTGEAKSALQPSLNLNAGAQRIRGGYQAGFVRVPQGAENGSGRSFIAPFETGLVSANLDTRWEISFWGPNSKRLNASKADLQEQIELQNEVRLIVGAEVARQYFELRGIEDQITVARRNLKNQEQLLELLRVRSQSGLSTELDVERQSAALASLDASIPLLELQRSLRMHRLAVLLADSGFGTQKLEPKVSSIRPPRLQAGIDSELLKRRPDVRAAYARIQAAAARAQQARSELYPRLLLTGAAGRQSTSVSGLTLGSGTFFNIGPQLVLPLFTGGKIRANIEATNAQLEEESLAYESELLAAFQEAEDAIAGYRLQQERFSKLEEALARARTALALSEELYRAGLGDFLEVLDAETRVVELELAMAESRASLLVQSTLLYKALAGGWPQ
ncbi:MAG: efflux transporter outer membrane subunit [Acidobacteriota bacterium]|nr:efflux transporter outer membrane subunit [Acidobacteriota bacterium]